MAEPRRDNVSTNIKLVVDDVPLPADVAKMLSQMTTSPGPIETPTITPDLSSSPVDEDMAEKTATAKTLPANFTPPDATKKKPPPPHAKSSSAISSVGSTTSSSGAKAPEVIAPKPTLPTPTALKVLTPDPTPKPVTAPVATPVVTAPVAVVPVTTAPVVVPVASVVAPVTVPVTTAPVVVPVPTVESAKHVIIRPKTDFVHLTNLEAIERQDELRKMADAKKQAESRRKKEKDEEELETRIIRIVANMQPSIYMTEADALKYRDTLLPPDPLPQSIGLPNFITLLRILGSRCQDAEAVQLFRLFDSHLVIDHISLHDACMTCQRHRSRLSGCKCKDQELIVLEEINRKISSYSAHTLTSKCVENNIAEPEHVFVSIPEREFVSSLVKKYTSKAITSLLFC